MFHAIQHVMRMDLVKYRQQENKFLYIYDISILLKNPNQEINCLYCVRTIFLFEGGLVAMDLSFVHVLKVSQLVFGCVSYGHRFLYQQHAADPCGSSKPEVISEHGYYH